MMAAAGTNNDKQSTRTCVGCRKTDEQGELIRFALGPDGRVVPDVFRRLPGRGASVHASMACLKLAATRGGFSKAFSCEVRADAEELRKNALALYERRILGLLLGASRSKELVCGTEAVRDAMTKSQVLLVVAADSAGRREELSERAVALGGHCVVFGTKASLGKVFGREELGILAVLDFGIAKAVKDVATAMASLSEVE